MKEETKRCSRCGKEKTLDHFYKSKTGKNKRNSICKKCILLDCKIKYREKNKIDSENDAIKERKYYKKESSISNKIIRQKEPSDIPCSNSGFQGRVSYRGPTMADKLLLSISEYAELSGISTITVFRRLKDGTIPFVQLGPRRFIPKAFLDEQIQTAMDRRVK